MSRAIAQGTREAHAVATRWGLHSAKRAFPLLPTNHGPERLRGASRTHRAHIRVDGAEIRERRPVQATLRALNCLVRGTGVHNPKRAKEIQQGEAQCR